MRIEWPTVAFIVVSYVLWTVSGALLWPEYPAIALILMTLASAQHSSLTHECLHGHPTRKRWVNEALVTMAPSVIYPYRRYSALHLKHHDDTRLTDPFEDPESYYRAAWRYHTMPRVLHAILWVNNTLIGRIFLGPLLAGYAFLTSEARLMLSGNRAVQRAWALHVIGLVPVFAAIIFWFHIPVWLYMITVVWGSLGLISIRTYAEHRWHDAPDGRSIIVERSPLSILFLNNNLHIVHHQAPAAPWYKLPAMYRERPEHWQALNNGYVYRNYFQLFKAYAFKPKEPVIHPALQREPAGKA